MRLEVAPGARAEISPEAVIGEGTRIQVHAGLVRIGAGAVLGDRCVLLVHDRVEVEPGARLGDGVVLVDFAHAIDDVDTPVRHQALRTAPIRVGAGAVVGHGAVLERGAVVAPGTRVAEHEVVRAMTDDAAAPGPRLKS